MVTCSNCGAGIADGEVFCGQCGAPSPNSENMASDQTVIEGVAKDVTPEPTPVEPESPAAQEPTTTPEPSPVELSPAPEAYQEYPVEESTTRSNNTCLWIVLSCLVIMLLMLCVLCLAVGALFTLIPDTFQQIFGSIHAAIIV